MSKDSNKQAAHVVATLVEVISPLLAGHGPDVQSAALAGLTAMWLAGHQDQADPENPALLEFREQAFALWCDTVRALVAPNVAMIRERGRVIREQGGAKTVMEIKLEAWAKVVPDAFLTGSIVQARNVIEMALRDIAQLGAENKRLRELKRGK